jgi:hypothetical protein
MLTYVIIINCVHLFVFSRTYKNLQESIALKILQREIKKKNQVKLHDKFE